MAVGTQGQVLRGHGGSSVVSDWLSLGGLVCWFTGVPGRCFSVGAFGRDTSMGGALFDGNCLVAWWGSGPVSPFDHLICMFHAWLVYMWV